MPTNSDSRWARRHARRTSQCPNCDKVIWRCNCSACSPGAPRWKTPSTYQIWAGLGAVHPQCWASLYKQVQRDKAAGVPPMPAQAPMICKGTSVTYVKQEDGTSIRLEDVQRQERSGSQER